MDASHKVYLKHIHKLIKRKNVWFLVQRIPDHGYCDINGGLAPIVIILDPRREFIPTLVHECLHGIYPDYSERKVHHLERVIMQNITSRQVMSLLRCFCTCAKLYYAEYELD